MFAGLLKVFQGAFQSFSVWTVYLIKKWGEKKSGPSVDVH